MSRHLLAQPLWRRVPAPPPWHRRQQAACPAWPCLHEPSMPAKVGLCSCRGPCGQTSMASCIWACAAKPHTFLPQTTAAATLALSHAADDCFASPTAALSGFLGSPTFQLDSSLAFGGPSAVLAAAPEPLTLSTPSYLPTAPAHRGAGTAVATCQTAAALQPAGGASAPAALSQESGQGSEGREPLFFSNVVPPSTAAHSTLLQQMQAQEGQQQQQPAARLAAQVAVPPVPPATFAQQQGLQTPSFAHNQHQLPFQLPPSQRGLMAPTSSLPFAAGGATMPGACSLQPSVPGLQQLCGSLHSLDVPLHG